MPCHVCTMVHCKAASAMVCVGLSSEVYCLSKGSSTQATCTRCWSNQSHLCVPLQQRAHGHANSRQTTYECTASLADQHCRSSRYVLVGPQIQCTSDRVTHTHKRYCCMQCNSGSSSTRMPASSNRRTAQHVKRASDRAILSPVTLGQRMSSEGLG